MSKSHELFELERAFWTGGAEFYEEKLAPAAMMVFPPPAGVLDRATTIQGISRGPRWSAIEMSEKQSIEIAPGVWAVSYRARAARGTEPSYRALIGSIYVREAGDWRLAFHQHTPLSGE